MFSSTLQLPPSRVSPATLSPVICPRTCREISVSLFAMASRRRVEVDDELAPFSKATIRPPVARVFRAAIHSRLRTTVQGQCPYRGLSMVSHRFSRLVPSLQALRNTPLSSLQWYTCARCNFEFPFQGRIVESSFTRKEGPESC